MHTIRSEVRGGGAVGSSAWVAKIIGRDPKFTFERQFVRKEKHLSGSGRSGHILFHLDEPGIYELRGVGTDGSSIARQARNGGGESGFIELQADGTVVDLERADVIARLEAIEARAPSAALIRSIAYGVRS